MSKLDNAKISDKAKEFSGLFTAVVESSDPITYNVVVCPINNEATSSTRFQAIPLSSCFANLFGFKSCYLPQPGMTVLCYKNTFTQCFIIGATPNTDLGYIDYPGRSHIGQGDSIVDSGNLQGYGTDVGKALFQNMRRPTDVNDADHVVANEFGVMMALFQHMAHLKGSELAQVQCHLLDDLVRIISHNFQHMTALGDYNIYHDGKALLAEFAATHIPQETYGFPIRTQDVAVKPFTEPGINTADDSIDFYTQTTNERVKAIERFKSYLGRLGDFINVFLTIPDKTNIPDLDGTLPKTPDLGAFNFHLGTDGGTHFRTIKDVFIEKVNWIRVPQRIRTPEDPTGDDASNITYPVKKEFEFDNSFTVQGNPFMYFLQLRDYVAYTMQTLNYSNINQHEKDFAINEDITKESPINNIGNVDPQTPAKNQAAYTLRLSGFYLMPNGGFLLKDAWGSAIVSEGGNIYIQPAKDLILQPLRNLIGKIGQFVSIASNNDIDLSSTTGGIRFKSDLAQYFYSDNSGLIFQANGNTPSIGTPKGNSGAIENVGGIVFKSTLGIYNYATTDILQYAANNLVLKSDNLLQEQGSLIQISSNNTIEIAAETLLGLYSVGSAILASSGFCAVGGAGSTAFGQKGEWMGFSYIPNDPYVDPIKGALDIPSLVAPASTLISTNVLQDVDSFNTKDDFTKLKFKFLSTAAYGKIKGTTDPIPQTIAQQQDAFASTGLYTPWTEKSVNDSYPYPGSDLFDSIYINTSGFTNLQKTPDGLDLAEKTDGLPTAKLLSTDTLANYPIYKIT
jgi:hypothetical protein